MFRSYLFLIVMLCVGYTASAQSRLRTGSITDVAGEPIIGATVTILNSNSGTISDIDGRFEINASDESIISISYIGYNSLDVKVGSRDNIEVQLTESAQSIDDVVVVAFGAAKKEAFTGSAGVLKAGELEKSQQSNAAQSIAGKVAGVQITNSSGQPGASPKIMIRGIGSLNADTDPLWVVDGIPYDGDTNNINPSDIESMTVLKDAASNALYGARGANGVIMITTKRAQGNEAVITVDIKSGVNSRNVQPYDYIKDPATYYETHYGALKSYFLAQGNNENEAHLLANSKIAAPATDGGLGYLVYDVPINQSFIGTNGKINPNASLGNKVSYFGKEYTLMPDDWDDEAYRTSVRQEYNISIAGRSDKGSFYNSYSYLNDKGVVQNSDMERFTARLRTDYQAKKWLKIGANVSYTRSEYNQLSSEGMAGASQNIFAFTSTVAPIYPLFVRDGEGNIMQNDQGITMYDYGDGMNAGFSRSVFGGSNAIGDSRLNTNLNEGHAFTGNGSADIQFTNNLKLQVNAGMSFEDMRYTGITNPYFGQYASENGTISKSHSRQYAYNLQQILNYDLSIDSHTINAMVGHEYYNRSLNYIYGRKSNMFSPDNGELDGAVIDKQSASSFSSGYNNEGYFARVQYDYNNKYFASASFRRDASSRFHPDNQWGNFWSLGGAWIISKEEFMRKVDWVNMLKFKSSIGSQGNDGIGDYRYVDTFSIENSDDKISVVFNTKGNKDITWETNTNFNIGFEFELFDNLVAGGVEYFNRATTDMLFSFPVAPSLGYSSYYANVGDMLNRGVELNLDFAILRNENLQWSANVNMTTLHNRLNHLPDQRKTISVDGYSGYINGNSFFGEGLPMYTLYLKRYAGVSDNGESMWYTTQEDGKVATTTKYSEATQYLCGDPTPDLFGGFGTSLSYKGFDFSCSFSYQIGGLVYDSGYEIAMQSPTSDGVGMNFHSDLLDAWTPTNRDSDIPRLQYGDNYSASTSDRFLIDASYLSLQNVNLGYTFPKSVTSTLLLNSLRVYIACDNLFLISQRQGLDPRYGYSGSSNNMVYSPVRTISGGVNLKF